MWQISSAWLWQIFRAIFLINIPYFWRRQVNLIFHSLHSYWAKLFYALRQWTPRNIWLILCLLIFVFKIGLDARTAEDVASVYIPKTVSLLRSYFALHWILEQTVTPTPSSAMYVCYTETSFVQLFRNNEDESLLFKSVMAHVCVFVKWGTIPSVLILLHKDIWS